ncbi:sulfur carrier protein ThiS [Mucilaginibacter mallensis]|uniref:Sulfur carrier protein ThiS n=1 Tax=Mucilaginibacter mallensis TaxID=652787 RepID=A0A1H1XXB4_MUCMA|nr:sulfur carrier protein ThiS [Mucilaginibacter mallensis]SDT13842.1 sulfur carrier protein ThiS [Mucilaginibacter mallensis]
MDITVNQQSYSVSEACSLQQMLDTVFLQPAKGIAIAVNQEIIPKNNWQTCQLQSGDTITIIKATQGG